MLIEDEDIFALFTRFLVSKSTDIRIFAKFSVLQNELTAPSPLIDIRVPAYLDLLLSNEISNLVSVLGS